MTRPAIHMIMAAGMTALLLTFVTGTNAQTSAPLNVVPETTAPAASSVDRLRTDLPEFGRWLATGSTGAAWRTYLEIDRLESELTRANQADPLVLAEILNRFAEGGPESDRPPYLDVRRDIEQWLDHLPPPPLDQIAAMAQAAKTAFVPRTKADVEQARKDLLDAVDRLDARLNLSGADGEAWRRYLHTSEIKEQLAKPNGPDLNSLDSAYARFSSGSNGLDLVWFKDVRDALRTYLQSSRAVGDPTVRTAYQQLLAALPEHLEAYRKNPTPDDAQAIQTALRYLEEAGQARWLVSAIRHYFVNPNVWVQVSKPVIEAGIAREVNNCAPINDCILGTTISGTGHTVGRIGVELDPNDALARIGLVFNGQTQASTTGYNGPVEIFSTSCAVFTAIKPLFIDAQQVSSANATGNATSNSVIQDIEAQRALVRRAAWKQAAANKGASDQVAAQHVSQRVADSLAAQSNDFIARADQRYQAKFRAPLQERRVFPLDLRYQTTSSDLLAIATESDRAQLTSPTAPPSVPSDDLLLRFHESAVNNFFEEVESGMILHEDEFLTDVKQFLGRVPEQFKPDPKLPPWGIAFAKRQPITVTFHDNQFSVLLRARRYYRGTEDQPGMNILALYTIQQGPKGLQATRQGELKITRPNGDPLAAADVAERDGLLRRFAKIFPAEIKPDVLLLPGAWRAAGQMVLSQWGTSDGWMVAAWHRTGEPAPPETPETSTAPTPEPAATPTPAPAASASPTAATSPAPTAAESPTPNAVASPTPTPAASPSLTPATGPSITPTPSP